MPPSATNNTLLTDPTITDSDLANAVRHLARTKALDYIFFEASTISAMRIANEDKKKRNNDHEVR